MRRFGFANTALIAPLLSEAASGAYPNLAMIIGQTLNCNLALTLLVLRVFANHADCTLTLDYLAFLANLFY